MQFRYHAKLTHPSRRGKQERSQSVVQPKSRYLASGTGASCEPDEARAPWQPEAYMRLGEPQPQARQADVESGRARASAVEGCHGARNVAVRAERLGREARAE